MRPKTLIIGYGNPGRQDDGLGPVIAEYIAQQNLPDTWVEITYQLNVEHADDLTRYDRVIFIDAAIHGAEPFEFKPIAMQTESDLPFSTHALSPQNLLNLAHSLFHKETEAYALCVRGYEFDKMEEKLTRKAEKNANSAKHFLTGLLNKQSIHVR